MQKKTIFEAFVQELLNMLINFLLALYLVYPSYLFNMGSAYMFSMGVETLRFDGYLTLMLLTHGDLVAFHEVDDFWRAPVSGKDPLKYRHLLAQVLCRTENVASVISPDAKPTPEWRRE